VDTQAHWSGCTGTREWTHGRTGVDAWAERMGYRRRDGNDWAATTGPARVPCGVVRRTHWGGPDGVRCGTERHTGVDAWADRTGYGAVRCDTLEWTHRAGRTGQDAPGRTHRAGRTRQNAPGRTPGQDAPGQDAPGQDAPGRMHRAGNAGQMPEQTPEQTPGKCQRDMGGPYILYFLYMIIYPSNLVYDHMSHYINIWVGGVGGSEEPFLCLMIGHKT